MKLKRVNLILLKIIFLGSIFKTFRFTSEYAMVVYSPIMSGRVEMKVISSKDTKAQTQTTSLFTGKLDGHVIRLDCSQATGDRVSCWVQTSENYVYFTNFKAVVNAEGVLAISEKRRIDTLLAKINLLLDVRFRINLWSVQVKI